jgi:hypothetical protein
LLTTESYSFHLVHLAISLPPAQAVTTWKDLGSKRAAEEYVAHLPVGLINISFSTAGLTSLPNLKRWVGGMGMWCILPDGTHAAQIA